MEYIINDDTIQMSKSVSVNNRQRSRQIFRMIKCSLLNDGLRYYSSNLDINVILSDHITTVFVNIEIGRC
jgi:hypothetical protein